jgi:hypothetical protein
LTCFHIQIFDVFSLNNNRIVLIFGLMLIFANLKLLSKYAKKFWITNHQLRNVLSWIE